MESENESSVIQDFVFLCRKILIEDSHIFST